MSTSSEHTVFRSYRALIAFILAIVAYGVLAVLAYHHAYFNWDVALARNIQSITLPGFKSLMFWISVLGTGWVPVVFVALMSVLLSIRGLRLEGILCSAGVALGFLVNRLSKAVISRPRPSATLVHVVSEYRTESFPSGHVVFFVEFFGFLCFLCHVFLKRGPLRPLVFVVFGGLIVLISVSRVYLGAHWPSDVLGACLGGALWLVVMIDVYGRFKSRKGSQREEA